jgi:hypothetical protein
MTTNAARRPAPAAEVVLPQRLPPPQLAKHTHRDQLRDPPSHFRGPKDDAHDTRSHAITSEIAGCCPRTARRLTHYHVAQPLTDSVASAIVPFYFLPHRRADSVNDSCERGYSVQTNSRGATLRLAQTQSAIQSCVLIVTALCFLSISSLHAQEANDLLLRPDGLSPIGPSPAVTEGWSTLQFDLKNPDTKGRDARVSVFYADRSDEQYAHDVWVPARARLTTWVPVGPATNQRDAGGRKIESVLYQREDGTYRPVLPPADQRVRSQTVPYRKREPTTALYGDLSPTKSGNGEPVSYKADLVTLARIPRYYAGLSDYVAIVPDRYLPATQESLDAVDVFVVAGNRLASDPLGRASLQRWVQEGGCLWVMLDRVELEVIAPILGERSDLAIVDRVGLTTTQLHRQTEDPTTEPILEHEQPVSFVRVLPSATDRVLASVNGWPAAFTRRLGRGKVVFTTLGARGWSQPRSSRDGVSLFPNLRDFPVPLGPATDLSIELHPTPEPNPLTPEIFRPVLVEEIGYTVVGRGTAAFILGGFVLILVGLTLGSQRFRRSTLVGWLGPAVAVIAALLFAGFVAQSRSTVPPTVGIAGVVDPVPGTGEVVISGMFAAYHQSSGPIALGTQEGAILGLDKEGLDGQMQRRLQTDTDSWHWDGLSVPAGVRTGPFRTSKKATVLATAKFGPDGVDGKLDAGPFKQPTDLIVATHAREPLAVRVQSDGSFHCGSEDVLPTGQYLAGTVLTDRQQRRQAVYKQLLSGPRPKHLDGRDVLMAWTDPSELPLVTDDGAKVVGALLLAVPLEFERSPPNTQVTVPRGFVPFRQVVNEKTSPVTMGASFPLDMEVRFQLPASVLPLHVERVTLFAQVSTPSRTFSVYGTVNDKPVSLFQAVAPTEAIRIVADPADLKLDDQGGLHLHVAVGAAVPGAETNTAWKIESLALEVVGRVGSAR